MPRATPALLLSLVAALGWTGCRTPAARPASNPAASYPTTVSDLLASTRAAYVETRAKELVRNGKFDTKSAARDFARYEWAEQHVNARTLGGEGYVTSTAPLISARQLKKQQKFLKDLKQVPSGPR